MADANQGTYTPPVPSTHSRKLTKRKRDTSLTTSKRRRSRSAHSSTRVRASGDHRKRKDASSTSASSHSSRLSRSPLRREYSERNRKRYSSRSCRYKRRRADARRKSHWDTSETEKSSARSSFSSDDSFSSNYRRSRSKSKHASKTRSRRPRSRSGSSKNLMRDFIDAINNRGSNAYVGAQEVIPQFDPGQKTQSTRAWLRKVNEVALIYQWNERQIIYHALPKLSGLARKWYEGLRSIDLSWKDWQRKLLKCFPDDRNYADRLTEMLNRRSRREETLEEYFYEKSKLVSRCNIRGKDAVDCIIHGIYDHNVQLNAQGANFKRPSQLLRYLRSISIKNIRPILDARKPVPPSKINTNKSIDKSTKFSNSVRTVKCFNCSEVGHTVPKCPKPLQRCTKCQRLGHIAEHCKREQLQEKNPSDSNKTFKEVQQITTQGTPLNIYHKVITVNGTSRSAFIDFGSQCTIMTKSTADDLSVLVKSDNLPVIKGFAFGVMKPIGRTTIDVNIDFVHTEIETLVVDDKFLNTDLLIGQNLTELPYVIVHKTNRHLVLYSENTEIEKIKIFANYSTELLGIQCLTIRSDTINTGYIYVPGSTSYKANDEHIILQGVYHLNQGIGTIIAINISGGKVLIESGKLLARAYFLPVLEEVSPYIPPSLVVNRIQLNSDSEVLNRPVITIDMIHVGPGVGQEQKERLLDLLSNYRDCFALDTTELGSTNVLDMHIKLNDQNPVSYKPYRLAHKEREVVRELVNELLENKIVQESDSSYASPIVLVKKKNNEYRLCVDYRSLNRKTVKDSYPMPVIDDQLDRLNGMRYFTSLDLKSGYYQIPMAEDSRHLTAFVTPDGHYEYTRMPFGLVNAPAVFQHMINKALGKDRYELAMPYMDDILSPSSTIEEGFQKLTRILDALRQARLTLNLQKCYFFQSNLEYLGYEISESGLRPGQRKTDAVASFPTPTTVHQVRQFVGLASFFRRFIPNFASIAKPLTILTKSDVPWKWGEDQEKAFQTIKSSLVKRPLLALYDPKYITEVHCDASKLGLGGILLQRPDEKSPLKPVAYFSKQTTKDEEFFHSYELETLAVVCSLKRFRTYLIGINFKVYTDCNALRTTLTKRDLVPRIARWWLLLQEYNFSIEYRPGDHMKHADALSRNPVKDDNSFELIEGREFEIMNIETSDWLQTVQMTDPELKRTKTILNCGEKDIKDILTNFVVKDDKVYRRVGDQLKWVVPKGARWRICQLSHDETGHFSYDKTLSKIKQDYWFPKMNKFIRKYVSSCLNCAYNKGSSSKTTGYLHPIPKGDVPFHTLHMDHLGPFVRSKRGNSYILGIIDGFSKFIFVKPVRNLKSKTTINILQELFNIIGIPKVIISDRGTSFTSATFKKFIVSIGAKHVLNAVATPRANGQIERYNRTILESLAATNHGMDERIWDEKVGRVQWSLNNTKNKSTGKTPAEIVFGFRTVNESEGPIVNALNEARLGISQNEELSRDEIRLLAQESTKRNQEYMKKYFDNTRAPTKFYKVGDLVMIPNHHNPADGKSKKLRPKFRGPFRVTAVLKNDRYEISSIEGHSKRKYKSVYPSDQLKKWITFSSGHDSDNNDESDNSDETQKSN